MVNIVGPRQAGKTTLVRDILQTGYFITLDDDTILEAIEDDPLGQLQRLTEASAAAPLIIDEAQRARKLPLAIKRIVDAENRPGQFVLTGSSNMFRTQHVADSLAGPYGYVDAVAHDRCRNAVAGYVNTSRLGPLAGAGVGGSAVRGTADESGLHRAHSQGRIPEHAPGSNSGHVRKPIAPTSIPSSSAMWPTLRRCASRMHCGV